MKTNTVAADKKSIRDVRGSLETGFRNWSIILKRGSERIEDSRAITSPVIEKYELLVESIIEGRWDIWESAIEIWRL
jgi:hypothetical protein